MARIRKAIVAGAGAGIAAAAAVLAKSPNLNRDTIGQAAGAFIVAAVPAAWLTWRVPNKTAA